MIRQALGRFAGLIGSQDKATGIKNLGGSLKEVATSPQDL
jgi:hypothetical protein